MMDQRNQLCCADVEQRVAAAEALSTMGESAGEAAVELVTACGDEEPRVREYAVVSLESLGVPPPETLDALTDRIKDDSPLVAYWAVTLLGRSGPAGKPRQNEIAAVLDSDADLSVRERAAWALEKVGADSDAAIDALQRAAQSPQPRLSRLAKAGLTRSPA
ncbi:hypothetical protein FYK55_16070 [Roseiconus nitratireducens]|uniref:HEAT repeat protein n=1 Tax=Roseiconus nitratireducens TaxID=2605748 RepID=A0A5M6D610_9BACT|nr:HEAT repeat domain-containing protein [Roseiconus nitratireducens]KAA5541742.1 hypothetical protein FYK55_16070 [Roseiconus nitratireducens]